MLTNEQLEELRDHLKNDPFNWPAHQLLNHIDDLQKIAMELQRKQTLGMLYDYGYSRVEADEILVHVANGGQLDEEEITCNHCNGRGNQFEMRCIGGSYKKCDTCYGRGRRTRPCIKK